MIRSLSPSLCVIFKDGQHRNPASQLEYFTTAFFHHPEELRAEVTEAGVEIIQLLGVEGPAWLARDFESRWAVPDQRRQLLELARMVEREPALLGLSQHLLILIVARKRHTMG